MTQDDFLRRICSSAQEKGKPVLEAMALADGAIFACHEGGNCGLYFDPKDFRITDSSLWDDVQEQAEGFFPINGGQLGFLPYPAGDHREEKPIYQRAQQAIEPFHPKNRWYLKPQVLEIEETS